MAAVTSLADFPLRSFWSLPPGAPRFQPVSPTKVALLGYQWVRTDAPFAHAHDAAAHAPPMCVGRRCARCLCLGA